MIYLVLIELAGTVLTLINFYASLSSVVLIINKKNTIYVPLVDKKRNGEIAAVSCCSNSVYNSCFCELL